MKAGLGVGLLSRDAAGPGLDAGTLEEWRFGPLPLKLEWHAVCHDHAPRATTALFVEQLVAEGQPGAFRLSAA